MSIMNENDEPRVSVGELMGDSFGRRSKKHYFTANQNLENLYLEDDNMNRFDVKKPSPISTQGTMNN